SRPGRRGGSDKGGVSNHGAYGRTTQSAHPGEEAAVGERHAARAGAADPRGAAGGAGGAAVDVALGGDAVGHRVPVPDAVGGVRSDRRTDLSLSAAIPTAAVPFPPISNPVLPGAGFRAPPVAGPIHFAPSAARMASWCFEK